MAKIKLKPCPFCGGNVELEFVDDDFYMVCCDKCNSATSFGYTYKDGTARAATKSETVKAWNKRADTTKVVRCKDCKYYQNHPNGLCYLHTEPCDNKYKYKGDAVCVEPNGFCSYGERRVDNDTQ